MPSDSKDVFRSPELIDHLTNPRNAGELEDADATVTVTNPVCGDELKLFLKVEEGRISDVRFKAYGCAAALAASSLLTEMVKGKTIEEARAITAQAVSDALGGLPAHKAHAGDLAEDAIQEALDQVEK